MCTDMCIDVCFDMCVCMDIDMWPVCGSIQDMDEFGRTGEPPTGQSPPRRQHYLGSARLRGVSTAQEGQYCLRGVSTA